MDFLEFVKKNKIFAVIRTNTPEKASTAIKAMIEGGVRLIEVTMTTPEACRIIAENVGREGVLVGAGSVTTVEEAEAAIKAGARFLISPVYQPQVVKLAKEQGLGVACGALTPTEIHQAWQQGADLVKIFPIDAMGGVEYLKTIRGPLPKIRVLVSGNIDKKNFITYLDAGAYAACFGSSLIEPEALEKNHVDKIAQAARSLVKSLEAYAWLSGGK